MHILMIAPEPFFEPRGTPFSEYHRIRALLELGHTVDLVTYPFGEDVALPGLRVFRALRPPFIRRVGHRPIVRQGARSTSRSLRPRSGARSPERYDLVHSHEEGAAIGVVLACVARRAAPLRHALEPAAATGELQVQPVARCCDGSSSASSAIAVTRSRVVIVICPELGAPGAGTAPRESSRCSSRTRLVPARVAAGLQPRSRRLQRRMAAALPCGRDTASTRRRR